MYKGRQKIPSRNTKLNNKCGIAQHDAMMTTVLIQIFDLQLRAHPKIIKTSIVSIK